MPPHPLCLSLGSGVEELKEGLASAGIRYASVHGRRDVVERFLEAKPRSKVLKVERHGFYQLRKVRTYRVSGAEFVAANAKDVGTLAAWLLEFNKECRLPVCSPSEASKAAAYKVKAGDSFLLKVGGSPVSAVCAGRTLPYGRSIGFVYTPPEERRKGYGAELTAKVSEWLLQRGNAYCCLFTQLENATSNKIYQDIGYEWVAEFLLATVE